MAQDNPRDGNDVPTISGVSSVDFVTPVVPAVNPITRRMLIDNANGTNFYSETPSGLINGSNVTYTVLHTINTVLSFAINGEYLHPTTDYTFSGTTITMNSPLDSSLSGKAFTIVYV